MSKSKHFWVSLFVILSVVGGCGTCLNPFDDTLAGNWALTTDSESNLPDTVLTFDSNSQLTKVTFTLEGGTTIEATPSATTTISDSTVTINVSISQGVLNFVGTLNEAQTVATGTLNAALTVGGATITLPGVDATLTKLLD